MSKAATAPATTTTTTAPTEPDVQVADALPKVQRTGPHPQDPRLPSDDPIINGRPLLPL